MNGVGGNNPAISAATAATVSTPIATGGASGPGGALSAEKDSKTASTDPKFGAILNQIQTQYGAKAEKPREIKKTLGKDDFLRIMITQMRHQDPTNPFKAEQMATEMAQFTSVEQLQNVNQNLAKMASANQPLERLAMTNLIGKTVTIDRERFPHTEGTPESLAVNLPKDAAEVKLTVVSADTGETVFDKDLGPQKAGAVSVNWDGRKSNTLPAKGGTYMLRVEAKDEQGRSLVTNPQGQARIIGISFEGAEPVFLVGDAKSQAKITMKNIVKIEDQGLAPLPAAAGGVAPVPSADKPANFFTFQKGVGSQNADAGALSPEVAKALSGYTGQSQAAPAAAEKAAASAAAAAQAAQASPQLAGAPARASAPTTSSATATAIANGGPAGHAHGMAKEAEEKGFPNGLHD